MSLENCSNEHNIDFIAKSFFIFMISMSFVNDLYSIKESIFSNDYIKQNINKLTDIKNIFKNFLSNKEKKTKDGFIIKNNDIIHKKVFSKNNKNTKNIDIINNIDNISNKKSCNNINIFPENNLSTLEEIKPLEIISDNFIKKKKKLYNNELMEEVHVVKDIKDIKDIKDFKDAKDDKDTKDSKDVKDVKDIKEVKEVKVKKKDNKQLTNKKKEDTGI